MDKINTREALLSLSAFYTYYFIGSGTIFQTGIIADFCYIIIHLAGRQLCGPNQLLKLGWNNVLRCSKASFYLLWLIHIVDLTMPKFKIYLLKKGNCCYNCTFLLGPVICEEKLSLDLFTIHVLVCFFTFFSGEGLYQSKEITKLYSLNKKYK